ncbi:hypothetical protein MKX01_015805 [Papaver californicum]|nr:hypothetical protein MKX01_015805 [Papaver californicum]
MDDKKRGLGQIEIRSRVLGETEVEGKGNGNGGVGETRQKKKCIRGGTENFDSPKVLKRNNGTRLRSPFSLLENIYKKTSNAEKKLVKSANSRTERVDKVEEVQSIRRSTRISNVESTHVFAESSEKVEKKSVKTAKSRTERFDKVGKAQGNRRSSRFSGLDVFVENSEKIDKRMVKSARIERVDQVEKVQGSRQSTRISNLEFEISPAMTPNVVSEEKVERKLVKSMKSRTKRVEEVQAVMQNVESKEKRMVEDGRVKEKNPAEGKLDVHGWTKDQDAAFERELILLQNPHQISGRRFSYEQYWFQVPGKTAQDCFNKIHSELVTPPQVQPRSRARKAILSPSSHFSLSGSKLLEPTLNVRWPKGNKQKKHHAQKTLRHLLQKRSAVDQGYEADLFSVLEPNAPTQGCIQECSENLSIQKKPLSRFRNSCETALVSPLKQVKNRALHEKYIDRLHCRYARRTAGPTKCNVAREDKKESTAKKMDDITVARNALVFEANDMISKFKEAQANVVSDNDDSQDGDACDGEDDEDWEGEDVISLAL